MLEQGTISGKRVFLVGLVDGWMGLVGIVAFEGGVGLVGASTDWVGLVGASTDWVGIGLIIGWVGSTEFVTIGLTDTVGEKDGDDTILES